MPIFINVGHAPRDRGKPWKHLSSHCGLLRERANEGHPAKKISNPDKDKTSDQCLYRRCFECFGSGGDSIAGVASSPLFLKQAADLQRGEGGAYWVYNISDPKGRCAQVGMARELQARLASRWKASIKSRFGQDCVPWLHDALRADPAYEPTLEAVPFPTRQQALAAEAALRKKLSDDGWHEGGLV